MEQNATNINWYPGHMAKTKRLIEEKSNLIDIVYELIDARIPYSSKIENVHEIIKGKPHILIMTKSDLCDINETKLWIEDYESKGYKVLLLDLTNNKDYKKLISLTKELMEPINRKRREHGLESKEIRVLVVGIPNVGKSTLVNRLVSKKATKVGNTPGVTQSLAWLKTDHNILLLDTPGILWPKFSSDEVALNLASMSAIKIDVLPKDRVAIHILKKLERHYPAFLLKRYGLEKLTLDYKAVYETIGSHLNIIKKNEEIDYEKISEFIINDIRSAKINNITFDRF